MGRLLEFLRNCIENGEELWCGAKLGVILLKDLPSTTKLYLPVLVRLDFKDEELGIEFG